MDDKSKKIGVFETGKVHFRLGFVSILLFLMCCHPSFAQPYPDPVSIQKISIEEADNSLTLMGYFADESLLNLIEKDSATLRLDINDGNTLFKDAIITKKERQSKNGMLLRVQPPLQASIYKTRKQRFILHLFMGQKNWEIEKSALLGSAFKTFDLRPYTHFDGFYLLLSAIALFLVFSAILFLLKSLRQKFKFKRTHVMTFLEAWEEGKPRTDPFTFVELSDQDKVVVVDQKVMLLSSWKRLKKLPFSKPAKENEQFFEGLSDRSFFNPFTETYGKTDRALYGLIGIFFGWLFYRLFVSMGMEWFAGMLNVLNSKSLQVSTAVAHDLLLGIGIGFCYAAVLTLVDRIRARSKFTASGIAKTIMRRASLIILAVCIQALITAYLIENPFINGLIAWGLLGMAFVFPMDFEKGVIAKKLAFGTGIGILSYALYQLGGIPYLRDLWGTDIPLFLGLGLLGCLGSALRESRLSGEPLAKLKSIRRPGLSLRKLGKSRNR